MRRGSAGVAVAAGFVGAVALASGVAVAGEAEPGEVPQVLIQVKRPGERGVPLALVVPEGDPVAGQAFRETAVHALELTGRVRVVPPAAHLERAGRGIRPGAFDLADWKPLGASALARASVTVADGVARVEVYVYAVDTGAVLAAKAWSGPAGAARRLALRASDAILQAIGEPPSFLDTRFAFVNNATGTKEIGLSDAAGGDVRALTRNGSINLKPRWSPTGTALSYVGYAAGNGDLYVADLAKGAIRRVSSRPGLNTGGAFSPLGNLLAVTLSVGGDAELFTVDAGAGREIARLTRSAGIDSSPAWSPDGTQVAFVSERSGSPQVYRMNADGSGARRVTFQGSYNTDPAWSPDGSRIAWVGRDGRFDVFTCQPDGRGALRITQGAGDNEDPSWSPDGQYLAFSSTREGGSHIWVSSADGAFQARVTSGRGTFSNPHWSPHLGW
jgi:TolB protein